MSNREMDKQERLSNILEGINAGTWEWNIKNNETVFNERWAEILGYSLKEISPCTFETWKGLIHPDDITGTMAQVEGHLGGELPYQDCEFRMQHKDGHWIWVHSRGKIISYDKKGAPFLMFGTHMDISLRKEAEQQLQAQWQLAQDLNSSTDLDEILSISLQESLQSSGMDSGGIYLRNEDSGALILMHHKGLSPTFLEQTSYYPPDHPNTLLIMKGEPLFMNHQLLLSRLKQNRESEFKSIGIIPIFSQNQIVGALNTGSRTETDFSSYTRLLLQSMTSHIGEAISRSREVRKVSQSRQELQDIFSSIADFMFIMDEKGIIQRVNDAVINGLGRRKEDLIGRPFSVIHSKESEKEVMDCLLNCRETSMPRRNFINSSGEKIPVESKLTRSDWDGNKKLIVISRDIRERLKMDEVIRNSQRLESLGILAGGIAHDFNNLLGGIFGNIELAKDRIEHFDDPLPFLTSCMGALNRARDLTRQLLTFSKGGSPQKHVLNLQTLLEESRALALSGSNINCSINLEESIHTITADMNQLSQVMNNLLLNARQAMSEGGKVEISGKKRELWDDEISTLTKGTYVELLIKDEGKGIEEQFISKIFDPFFTTKKSGTGLGLATCHSIIKKHQGTLTVQSEPGKGTEIGIYIPYILSEPIAEKDKPKVKTELEGRILVMDDEPIVLDVTVELLKQIGFETFGAANGEEAINLVKKEIAENRSIDLVLLDLTISGGLGGEETMRELHKLDPEIKGIVASGYAENDIVNNPGKFGFAAAIAKPYDRERLKTKLEEVL